MYLGSFFKVNVQNGYIFVLLKFQIFFRVSLIFQMFVW